MLLPKPYLCLCFCHPGLVVSLLQIWPLFLKCLARLLLSRNLKVTLCWRNGTWLKALPILSEDLGLVPYVLMSPHNCNWSSRGLNILSGLLRPQACIELTDTEAGKSPICIKYSTFKMNKITFLIFLNAQYPQMCSFNS